MLTLNWNWVVNIAGICNKPVTEKKTKPLLKTKPTIAELQKQGFKETSIKDLFLTSSGKAYNNTTKRELKPTQGGKVVVLGKAYSLAKLILQKYKSIPVKSGKIIFLNGNSRDFDFNNLSYATKLIYKAPTESQIINAIRLYFKIPTGFNRQNVLFKYYLHQIAIIRGFVLERKENDFFVFNDWLTPGTYNASKAEISIKSGFTQRNGTNSINKYLSILINDCSKDLENGILTLKDLEQKPLTQSQKVKKTNETLKELGFKTQLTLNK